MIVLHAIWDKTTPGTLHLWGESSEPLPALQPDEKPDRKRNKLHPFALSQVMLQEATVRLLHHELLPREQTEITTLSLPSSAGRPLPSPGLLLDEDVKSTQKKTLKRWHIETYTVAARAALDFLLELPIEAPQGITFGDSLRFWTEAAKLTFELITRQCFVPALTIDQPADTGYASWVALFSPEDRQRVRALARAMPPMCWAGLSSVKKNVSLPHETLVHFLNRTIDGFVRAQVTTAQLVPERRRGGQNGRENFAERWMRALSTPVGAFALSSTDMATALETQKWLALAQVESVQAPFRTCFKLDPPSEEQADPDTWRVSFHLQANDDHSLLIPAEKAWQERSETLTFLSRKFDHPQERLLADLGKASRLFPLIEQSLKTARPQELLLNTEQAYMFLRETSPLLESSGFGVLVPPWWQKASARIGVKLKLKPQADSKSSLGLLGFEKIVNYDWNIAIGDKTLSIREFEQLVDLKLPLVKVRGQWVELRPDQIEAAIAFFKKKYTKQAGSLAEALRDTLGEDVNVAGLPITGVEAEGWIKDALDKLTQRVPLKPIEAPASFHGRLRPYQLRGVSWLAFLKQLGFGSCLADDMGLGKTIQLITLLLHEIAQAKTDVHPGPTLLICPMSIVGNWQRELQRFAPSLSVMVHHGTERLSGPAFAEAVGQYDVVITTYSMALRDREHLELVDWHNVVIDEAQNIKNESAKQTQAIKSLKAASKIALTGTPVENRLAELWSIMDFLNPGYLGSGSEFRKTFGNPIERYRDADQSVLLKRLIQPFVLRRLKTDKEIIQDLPDKMEMNVFCNLTQEQASLYEAVLKEMLEKIEETDGMTRRGLILATLTKLKQICNHPTQFMSDGSQLARRSGKLARLEEMLEEVLSGGEKALVFTQYAEMGSLLRQHLQETLGVEVLFLHGATVKKQRDLLVQRFQEERHGAAIFILSLKAGGVGLNLTAANHVFHFDRWWNPAVENQATDRAFRIGQRKNVQVHKFVCVGTLEERIDQMIEQKRDLAERIVGEGENWLTEMSTDQLKELFALSREAVGE